MLVSENSNIRLVYEQSITGYEDFSKLLDVYIELHVTLFADILNKMRENILALIMIQCDITKTTKIRITHRQSTLILILFFI